MSKEEKITAGTEVIDKLLDGGYEKACITTVFGPGGSGKTNLCMLSCIQELSKGKKVIYVDTDGSFSFTRFRQLNQNEELLEKIIFFKPINFKEQKKAFEDVKKMVEMLEGEIGLIVVDSIAMLYRLELGKTQDVYGANKNLGTQLAYLIEIARTKSIPVILTNQVYADINNKEQVHMVGGDLLKYSSKCLIELKKGEGSLREAIIRKHRSLPELRQVFFSIEQNGLKEVEKND